MENHGISKEITFFPRFFLENCLKQVKKAQNGPIFPLFRPKTSKFGLLRLYTGYISAVPVGYGLVW